MQDQAQKAETGHEIDNSFCLTFYNLIPHRRGQDVRMRNVNQRRPLAASLDDNSVHAVYS